MEKNNPAPKRKADYEDGEPMWLIIFISIIASVLTNLWLRGFL